MSTSGVPVGTVHLDFSKLAPSFKSKSADLITVEFIPVPRRTNVFEIVTSVAIAQQTLAHSDGSSTWKGLDEALFNQLAKQALWNVRYKSFSLYWSHFRSGQGASCRNPYTRIFRNQLLLEPAHQYLTAVELFQDIRRGGFILGTATPMMGDVLRLCKLTYAPLGDRKTRERFETLRRVVKAAISATKPNEVPQSTGHTYRVESSPDADTRAYPTEEEYKSTRPLLELLIAALDGLSAEELATVLDIDASSELPEKLRCLGRLVAMTEDPHGGTRYSIQRDQIDDWLTDTRGKAASLRIEAKPGHQALAQHGWRVCRRNSQDLSSYLLKHLIDHLLAVDQIAESCEVLTNLTYIEGKCRQGQHSDLSGEFDKVLEAIAPESDPEHIDQPRIDTLRQYAQELVEFSRQQSEFRSHQPSIGTRPRDLQLPTPPRSADLERAS